MTHSPQEPVDLTDPAISPHRLQELAQTHPEAWDEILAHPNVYPGLADWIRDRQAEQAATQAVTAQPEHDPSAEASDVDATKVVEPVTDAEPNMAADEPLDVESTEPAADPINDEAEPAASPQQDIGDDAAAEQPSWASPNPAASQYAHDPTASESWSQDPAQQPSPTGQSSQGEPLWGWPGATSQPSGTQSQHHYQTPSAGYGQQPYGYQQQHQMPYGYQGQAYGQQQPAYGQAQVPQPSRRDRTPIDLNSARTWGIFVTGGAAFMTLFGFFFSATASGFGIPTASHLSSGGWLMLLLFLATVTLSILQLVKPAPWTRYFFIVVSFGAAFTMIGRSTALIGFFTMQNTSFSVIWMLFMSLVLLAGIMVYTAPRSTDATDRPAQTRPAQQPPQQFGYHQPHQPGYGQYPGNPPYGGSEQSWGGYPSGPQ